MSDTTDHSDLGVPAPPAPAGPDRPTPMPLYPDQGTPWRTTDLDAEREAATAAESDEPLAPDKGDDATVADHWQVWRRPDGSQYMLTVDQPPADEADELLPFVGTP